MVTRTEFYYSTQVQCGASGAVTLKRRLVYFISRGLSLSG